MLNFKMRRKYPNSIFSLILAFTFSCSDASFLGSTDKKNKPEINKNESSNSDATPESETQSKNPVKSNGQEVTTKEVTDQSKVPNFDEIIANSVPDGLTGGHFDLDTSSHSYKLGDGDTDHHVHAYDDKYGVLGVDFFNLLDAKLGELNEVIDDSEKRFILILANTKLSTGAIIRVNGKAEFATDYAKDFDPLKAQVYTTGTPTNVGDIQLKSLEIYFEKDSIINGGLVGTQTSQVIANEAGDNGEYRNAAFIIQAIDANDIEIDKVLGVAKIESNALLWESTLFWHIK